MNEREWEDERKRTKSVGSFFTTIGFGFIGTGIFYSPYPLWIEFIYFGILLVFIGVCIYRAGRQL